MFKPMILSTLLTRAMVFALTVSGIAAAAEFRAGVGKSDIQTSADMWPIDGFTSQHDPLSVRVLLLDDSRTRAAIVVIDQTSISADSIAKIKALLTKLTGISSENTIVVASHTFSAPHVFGGPPSGGGKGGLAVSPAARARRVHRQSRLQRRLIQRWRRQQRRRKTRCNRLRWASAWAPATSA